MDAEVGVGKQEASRKTWEIMYGPVRESSDELQRKNLVSERENE